MQKSISVVIPNYNGTALLKDNLPSVYQALKKLGSTDYEVIVADDASKDDSVDFLEKNYPEIVIVKNAKNLGFSGNINSGLKVATKDLVLALNSDVKLTEDYFIHQMKYFNDAEVFGVMTTIVDPRSQQVVDSAKYAKQSFFGVIKSTLNAQSGDKNLPSFFLSGANALIDRKKLEKIDYFNELFSPFYGEDVDLGMRAWRMGWTCIYEPKSICYHEASSTIQSSHKKNTIRNISRRNKFTFHDLHLDSCKRFLFFSKVALDLFVRWLVFDFNYYKSFSEYLQKKGRINNYKKMFGDLNPKYKTQDALQRIESEFKKSKITFLN
ncbi:MAG: glycosyltransferase family 2 protein [Bdellovibrionota bacterium]